MQIGLFFDPIDFLPQSSGEISIPAIASDQSGQRFHMRGRIHGVDCCRSVADLGVRHMVIDPLWEGLLASRFNLDPRNDAGTRISKMIELISRLNDEKEDHKTFSTSAHDHS